MVEPRDPYQEYREEFLRDENRNVFVVMRFASEPPLIEIEQTIKDILARYGLNAILARDVKFHEELWNNVKFCMDNSRYAIVVFEQLIEPDFNPNVTLELGYMLAQRKACLILKDKSLRTLHSDIIGRLYEPFDSHNVAVTVSAAVEQWLHGLHHTLIRPAETISGSNHVEANKKRTEKILASLSGRHKIIRQAAGLSSLAISDNETYDGDDDGAYDKLLLRERHRFMHLLSEGCTIRLIICPEICNDQVELGLATENIVKRNILPRYDQLLKVLNDNKYNENLQIVFTLRLPHDNLLIADDDCVLIGRKRRRQSGFPYTTQIFDPAIIRDEATEFDAIFSDNIGPLIDVETVTESHYGSPELKKAVIAKLKRSKQRIQRKSRSMAKASAI